MAGHISSNYPWTQTSWAPYNVGAATTDPPDLSNSNQNVLRPILDEIRAADLVIDASASLEVQSALSFYCRRMNVPYLLGYSTLGVAGGLVARFMPQSPACLVCLQEHWHDGTIPQPRVDLGGVVTPVGCNAPTFTGGSFDLQEISLEMTRTAVGLLTDGKYDAGNWQIALLTLKTEDGGRVLPRWKALEIPGHPKCSGHAP